MGKWRAVVPIVLALVIAVVASVLIYKWMKKQTAPKEVAKIEEVKIKQAAVAEVNLPAGTKLKEEQFKTVSFLEESLPPGIYFERFQILFRGFIFRQRYYFNAHLSCGFPRFFLRHACYADCQTRFCYNAIYYFVKRSGRGRGYF